MQGSLEGENYMKRIRKIKLNKTTRNCLIVIGILLVLLSAMRIFMILEEDRIARAEAATLIDIVDNVLGEDGSIVTEEEKELKLSGKSYSELLEINSDFVGWLSFKSGLVNQPVVQSRDNVFYLTHSFFGKKSSIGTAFLDYNQNLDMQNITIYGHLVYRDNTLMFSPLQKLVNQANYDANRYFSFSTETEVRNYEVAIVFYYDVEEDAYTLPYYYGSFDEETFNQYVQHAKEKQFYETGVKLTYEDSIITLQTCVQGKENLRLIIVGKLISVEPMD